MSPPAAPKNQTPFDDEISLLDIIQFFKANLIKILFFVLLGGMLAALYVKNNIEVYRGTLYLIPAKFDGNFITDPKITLTKLQTNSNFNKKTFLLCQIPYYKSKDFEYFDSISNKISSSIVNEGKLIKLSVEASNKEMINLCLEEIAAEIIVSENKALGLLVQSRKNDLFELEERLRITNEEIANPKVSNSDTLLGYALNYHISSIPLLYGLVEQMRKSLAPPYTNPTYKLLPVNFEQINKYPLKIVITLGLFLGGILGLFVSAFLMSIRKAK